METIEVPDSLESIGEQAFTINTGNPAYDKVVITTKSGNNPKNIPDGENYIIDLKGSGDQDDIDYTIWTTEDFLYEGQTIKGFSSTGYKKIKRNGNLEIPENTPSEEPVLKIGIDAFRNLNAGYDIEKVSLPDSIREIEDYALQFNSLEEVKFPKELERFGMGVFMSNPDLAKVAFNDKLKFIDQSGLFL